MISIVYWKHVLDRQAHEVKYYSVVNTSPRGLSIIKLASRVRRLGVAASMQRQHDHPGCGLSHASLYNARRAVTACALGSSAHLSGLSPCSRCGSTCDVYALVDHVFINGEIGQLLVLNPSSFFFLHIYPSVRC
jgi:hypothetical protein